MRAAVSRDVRSSPSATARRTSTGPAILRLQSQAGNAAVSRLVAQRLAGTTVQRDELFEPFGGLGETTTGEESGAGPAVEPIAVSSGDPNEIVGLKRQDGLDWGTWEQRPRVKRLQGLLNDKTAAGLKIDGMWGKKTSAALHQFQQEQGLPLTEHIDQTTAERLTGTPVPPEEEGVVDPAGTFAEPVPDAEGGRPKPRGGGSRNIFPILFQALSRQIEQAPEPVVSRDRASIEGPGEDLGQRWFTKVRCLQTFLRDLFGRLIATVKGVVGTAISTAADFVHGAITAGGTAIAGPVGFLVGFISGWFVKQQVAQWVKDKANRAIDTIAAKLFTHVQTLNQGIFSLMKPVINTMTTFLSSWEKVVSWADPWLGTIHDAVKWIRDTLAKFHINSDRLGAVERTLGDIRAWGRKPLEGNVCEK